MLPVRHLIGLLAATSLLLEITVKGNEDICFEGFAVDVYCLAVGFFPHVTVRSLNAPENHTVHCLIDDTSCINSGFEILMESTDGDGSASKYCRAYQLNSDGNEMLVELAKSTGVCDDCYANTTSQWVKGFRATVFGRVIVGATDLSPAFLDVSKVLPSSVGCDEVGGPTPPEKCIYEAATLTDSDAPCWDEENGCVNLDDPFTKPDDVANPSPTPSAANYSFTNALTVSIISLLHFMFSAVLTL